MGKKGEKDGKLNIAMLGHKRIPSREGGVEIVVEELATRMVSNGHKVTAYNRSGHHVSGKEFDTSKKKVKEYKGVRIKKVLTIEMKGLAALSSSFFAALKATFGRYDVIHFHAEGPSVMTIIAKLSRKKIIVTIHGLDWQRAKWGKGAVKYLKMGEKFAAKYADEVIVLSENVRKYFKEVYDRDTVFIPNGINEPDILPVERIKERWQLEGRQYILYLGRIVPEKGIHYLIEAYKQIHTDYPLVIAGGSSDTDEYFGELKKLSEDNKNIIFTDFVQGKELEELYSNAYVYVLPSDLEGMPLSLLEAMSYGNCCLVSDIPECAEVVEDKAFTFTHSNVESLKEKLDFILGNQELVAAYRQAAKDYILKKYDWDDVVLRTLALYEKKKVKKGKPE